MKDITGHLSLIPLGLLAFLMLVPFAFAEEVEGVPDASGAIDDGFDELGRWFEGLISNANVTGNETPLNTTEAELQDLLDDSIATGKAGKNFLFTFHHLVESFIYVLVPEKYEIDPLFVLLISWGVGAFAVYMIFRRSIPHMVMFAGIFGVVIILFMIGGINPQF
ncbi:MAG: hypothetical protein K5790_10425 [Nitrosopumilus sp.]|uniref:hypothetical protein n=1 Tax=Nitrosopumilus sp. TaxID=2024843 RepID=UPI00247DFCCD|nr:hypothetical protein [Nitrosopumilus sp.]MCV0393685.1 hypothetical protein [Nitrosopumilus sp.]